MTKSIKTCLLTVAALLGSISAYAHDFEVDGIYYDIYYNKTSGAIVKVTFRGSAYNSYNEYSGDIIIPSTVTYSGKKYSVKSIEERAFQYCSGLTSVTIPNSVTSIGEWAFSGCSGLTSVTIPNSVKSIERNAFDGCYFVKEKFINNSKLSGVWGATLCDYETEDGLLINGTRVERCRPKAENVTIPISVTSIGNSAFRARYGLTSVTIPNSVTSIGDFAFYGCSGLTLVTIPNSVTSIGIYAFAYCSGLTSVTIPNSVTSIGKGAFRYCI